MEETQQKQFLINESLLVVTINYLRQQKHIEVDDLVTALKNIPQVEIQKEQAIKNNTELQNGSD